MDPLVIALVVVLAAALLFVLLLLVQRSRRKGSLKVRSAPTTTSGPANGPADGEQP